MPHVRNALDLPAGVEMTEDAETTHTLALALASWRETPAYALANIVRDALNATYPPDTSVSAGAIWLESVRDAMAEALEAIANGDDTRDASDVISETADSIVPVYTHPLWTLFVELGAYQVDISDVYTYDASRYDAMPSVALYMMAEAIGNAIAEDLEITR